MIDHKISKIDLTSVDPSISMESRSGLEFSKSLKKQRWKAAVTWVTMKNDTAKSLFADLVAMQGKHGQGALRLPLLNQHPNMSGTITTDGQWPAGATQIYISGFNGEFSRGGTFNIAGHSKLYMIVSQTENVINFAPALRKTVNNAEINYTTPTLAVRKNSDDTPWNMVRVNGQLNSEFIEVLD